MDLKYPKEIFPWSNMSKWTQTKKTKKCKENVKYIL